MVQVLTLTDRTGSALVPTTAMESKKNLRPAHRKFQACHGKNRKMLVWKVESEDFVI